jgi:uncharacterized repeat protein (TIGR01451 family)
MGARRLFVTAGASVIGLGLMSAVVVQGSGQAMAAPGKPAAIAGHAMAGRDAAPAATRPRPPAQGIAVTVSKTADPDPYVPGEPLTFTVSLSTSCVGGHCPVGAPSVIGVLVRDPLPAQLSHAKFRWTCAASAGSSCAASGTGGIRDSAHIAELGTLTYTVKGTVPASARRTLVTVATVTPAAGETIPVCDPDCAAAVSVPPAPIVGLRVAKRVAPHPYVPGRWLAYTVTVSNSGPSDAFGARIDDPLPAALAGHGFTWKCRATAGSSCAASGSGAIHDIVTIAVGGHLTYTVTGTVPPGTRGTLTETATATPPSADTDQGCSPHCSATARDTPVPAPPVPPVVPVTG